MTKAEIWKQLVKRYGWTSKEDTVKLKAGGIKALIDQAWDEGYATRSKNQEGIDKLRSMADAAKPKASPFSDLFGG